jgi:hypothetical protein
MALVSTTLQQARLEKLSDLARVLPQVIGGSTANVEGLSKEQAAKEIAAVFSQVTQSAVDTTGDPSRTFMNNFTSKLDSFFDNIDEQRAIATDDVAAIERRQAKGTMTEEDKLVLPQLQAFLQQSANMQDSGGLISRIEQLRSLPAVADFFKDKTPVEAQFTATLGRLLDSNDGIMGGIKNAANAISVDANTFEAIATKSQTFSSQTELR